ncbi:N-6 DNA methylase [Marinomonas sp. M1K-6]|uniref:site-specific DNA-methyltransferase (adenine-specific) n=1 Tax=Marinomonas profundi TaxID=2726122 RepID=A0A847QYI2_9GAMM|nr:N-6 DNA methylase [Marinomonas profundi]NLQ18019.1 N-6 DNA methylase [Marinomonas profundi]UDV01743.1 N-6 DNA methylase [Marinomonas profundi]
MPAQDKKTFSQYYTQEDIAKFMASIISGEVDSCIDIGAGEGALIKAVKKIKKLKSCVAIDLDPKNVKYISNNIDSCTAILKDSTRKTTIKEIISYYGRFDLVIGNPPYGKSSLIDELRETLEATNLKYLLNSKFIPTELIFIVHGLLLLKNDAQFIYVIPDGILTNIRLKKFREELFKKYTIKRIIEIPPKSFVGTEAKTHIIQIVNKKPKHSNIILSKLGSTKKITIQKNDFINRGDYNFYNKPISISKTTLRELETKIIRGKHSGKYLKNLNIDYIHTNNIENCNIEKKHKEAPKDFIYSIPGDILVARVGSRSIGKVNISNIGGKAISDCIIVIRIKDESIRYKVYQSLKSSFGVSWLKSVSKGVGAKHITISEIYRFPMIL